MSRKKYAPRIRLTQDEAEVISQYRAIKNASDEIGVNDKDVKHGWLKSKDASLFFKNPNFKTEVEQGFDIIKKATIEAVKNHAPKYKKIDRVEDNEANLLVIDIADLHIGKLASAFETGEDYNCQIAVQRAKEGLMGIIQKSKGYTIDKILFVAGNDILHTDNTKRQTTSGTPQDTDGMWYDNFLTAKQLYIDLLEMLVHIADVEVVYNPSNHDYTHGFFLMQLIEAHFNKSQNIVFNVDLKHRKAFQYYDNFIGTTHGDGAKLEALPLLYATEHSILWANTKHRYVYTHHVHHKNGKDFPGITIESLRSPSGTDSWHHRNGFCGGIKAVEGYIHSKYNGQIARFTHLF
jgi:hypothetical protein